MSLHDLSNTIEEALAAAGLDTRRGPGSEAVETIRKALEAASMAQRPSGMQDTRGTQGSRAGTGTADAEVIDVEARVIDADKTPEPAAVDAPAGPGGQFLGFTHAGPQRRMDYKLYVPAAHTGDARLPLVVMLHGCKQNPDDFARGTRLNQLAEEQGFLVAYPAQSRGANRSNCWNWFEPQQQTPAGVEPSTIVGIVREISATYRVDERRVFVAGLSAGAAMAVILGDSYPDVFAAVAAHSGLPRGAAHDVPSAFAAMHGAAPPRATAAPAAARAVPTIVFHGEADATVVAANGAAIAEQSLSKRVAEGGPLKREVEQRLVNGRRCMRTTHVDDRGRPAVEHWSVQGGGHAWFREMLRFFRQHAGSAADSAAAQPQAETS
jgi:poly(hydroxyalkanoate) depolymerase family esterase